MARTAAAGWSPLKRAAGIRLNAAQLAYGFATLLTGGLVLYPLFWLLLGSLTTEGGEWTLAHYRAAYRVPMLREAIWNTMVVASGSTALAVVWGALLAWVVVRTDTPLRGWFEVIGILPFITTPFVGAMAWVTLVDPGYGLFNQVLGLAGIRLEINIYSLGGLIWVVGLYTTPYVFLLTSGALRSMNPELEEAATIGGARTLVTMLRITLFLVLPAILSGALLAFVNAMAMFGVHAVLGRPANLYLLTTAIYEVMAFMPPRFSQGAALAAILLLVTVAGVYAQTRILGGRGFVTVGGKGYRPKLIRLERWRWLAFAAAAGYMGFVVILPYLALLMHSFQNYAASFSLDNLTLRNYGYVLWESRTVQRSLLNSLMLALVGATLAAALSAVVSYLIVRTGVRGRQLLNFIAMIPFAVPGMVMGVGYIWAYSRPPLLLYGTVWILLAAYVTKELPIGVRGITAGFLQVHRELDECARICGVSWPRMFWRISLPLVKPQIIAAWILMFSAMVREVSASILLYSSGNEVVAVAMFDLWEGGFLPPIAALALITAAISLAVILGVQRLAGVRLERPD